MRIAAGILTVLGAVLGITLLRAFYGFIPGLLGSLPWLWACFVAFGGVYTLKRANWKICLFSSILLLPYLFVTFLTWRDALSNASGNKINVPFAFAVTVLFLTIGIFPVISVCLRKREWARENDQAAQGSEPPAGSRKTLKRVLVAVVGLLLLAVGPLIVGRYVDRQSGREAAIQKVHEESVAAGAPTGYLGAKWLMSMAEVKALFPDAIESDAGNLRIKTTAFARPVFVNLMFSTDSMTMVIFSFMSGNTHSTYARTQETLEREYGTFPRPERTGTYLLKSRKVLGRVAIDHLLYEKAGIVAEQVLYYRTKE